MEDRITSMIPRYGKLNKIYTEIMSGGSFSFEKQQFISGFYGEYGDTQTFETALISLMLEMDAAHFSILLNSLKREIESNISTYNTCREFFDRLDTEYVCRRHESRFDWDIDRQMKVTNGYYRELMEANGSLEAVGFREHDCQEEELLERRYERCKREYDKEKAKLDELYRQKEQARREALQCLKNRCGDICRLGGSLLAILEKYLTDQKKRRGGKGSRHHTDKPTRLLPHETLVSRLRKMQRRAVRSYFRTGLLRQHEPATVRRQTENKTEGESPCMLSHFPYG